MVFEQEEHSSPVTMITLLLLPVINSILDVLRKILVERLKSPLLVTSIRASLHAIFLYLLSTYSQELNFEVKKWLSSTCNWVNAFIIFLGSIFYLKAIMISNLSSTVPLLSQTPFFLMLTGCLWYGETINITSSLGLFLIIIGYVAMNFSNLATSKNVLKINIYTLFFPTDKGAKFIMMVPLLWSISAALEQTSLVELNTHPTVHICLTQAVVALISLCFLFLRPYSVEYLGEEIVDVLDYKSLRTSKRDKDLGKEQLFNVVYVNKFGKQSGDRALSKTALFINRTKTSYLIILAAILAIFSYTLHEYASNYVYSSYITASKRSSIILTMVVERMIFQPVIKNSETYQSEESQWMIQLFGSIFLCTGNFMVYL